MFFIHKLAEVPGAARVNLQPAGQLLFCKQFSAFSFLGPPGPGGRGQESNQHQNLPWTGGDMRAKFHHDRCRKFPLAIHIPTDRQTDKQTSVHLFLNIY